MRGEEERGNTKMVDGGRRLILRSKSSPAGEAVAGSEERQEEENVYE